MSKVPWRALHTCPWTLWLGVAFLVHAQWLWARHLSSARPGGTSALIGLALLLLGARQQAHRIGSVPVLDAVSPVKLGRKQTLVSVVGLAICGYTGVRAVEEDLIVWKLLALWSAGTGLIAAGLIPGLALRAWTKRVASSWRAERRTWVMVAALFGVALAIRTIDLETVPYIMSGDDAQFAQEAVVLKSERGWVYNPFRMGFWYHPRIVHTLMAVSIQLLGPTVAASRLPWAILGALTVPATFLLARRLFDARVGWCAALLLTTLPVHLHFSRISMDMTGDTFFLALALGLAVGAMRHNDPVEAALAGVSLGLTQYFYFAGRIAPLIAAGMLMLYALDDWRRGWQRWRTMLVLFAVAAGVAFPGLYAIYAHRDLALNPRLKHVGIWQTGDLQRAREGGELEEYVKYQLEHSLLAYVQFEDESDVFGRYGPLLSWYTGVPFLAGLALLLRRWREPRSGLLMGWVAGTALIGGGMLVDPPHFPRYIIALPGAVIVAAAGIVWVADATLGSIIKWRAVRHRVGDEERWYSAVPLSLSLALAVANQLIFSFGYLPKTPELLYGERTRQLNDVVTILDGLEGRYAVWRFSSLDLDMNSTNLLRYLTPENAGHEYEDDFFNWRDVLQPGPTAFVIAPQRLDEVVPKLAVLFPEGVLQEYLNPRDGSALVYVYLVDIAPWEGEQESD